MGLFCFLLASLPFLAAAAPAPVSSGPISLIAARSASPIHLAPINAAGQAFWIGKKTSSYCPLNLPTSCPKGTSTVIGVYGDVAHPGTAYLSKSFPSIWLYHSFKNSCNEDWTLLDVLVPGGQRMYIRPNGALGYTQAHSGSIPTGSTVTGFTYTPGIKFGTFGINLPGAAGLLACPTGKTFAGLTRYLRASKIWKMRMCRGEDR